MLENLIMSIALLLPMPSLYVNSTGPFQGAWLSLGKYELTIQKGPSYKAAIMLYGPDRTKLPDALYWDNCGKPHIQRAQPL